MVCNSTSIFRNLQVANSSRLVWDRTNSLALQPSASVFRPPFPTVFVHLVGHRTAFLGYFWILNLSSMPCCVSSRGSRIWTWFRDYDRLQSVAVFLIYVQIGCSLVGSLGALYNGVLLINLVVALFALVAIENNSQSLGRAYAALLACGILLDITWFILFSEKLWNVSPENHDRLFLFSLRLVLSMQIVGFSVRSISSLLWIQMYRLGVSWVDGSAYREADFDVRNSFLNPPMHEIPRQNSYSDEFLGGSIYDPAYYSTLFEDIRGKKNSNEGDEQVTCKSSSSTSATEPPKLKSCVSRSFHVINACDARSDSPRHLS